MTIKRHGVSRRYSDLVIHGDIAYFVVVGESLKADITTQTREALADAEKMLAQAGSDKSRLLQAVIYLPDMADYAAMNEVWDAWLPEGAAPSRACIQAGLANPDMRIEIVFTAALRKA